VTKLRIDDTDLHYLPRLNQALTDELYRRAVLPQILFTPVLFILFMALDDAIEKRSSIGWLFLSLLILEVPRALTIIGDRWVSKWYSKAHYRLWVFILFSGLIGCGLGAINLLAAKVATVEQITLLTFATAGFNSVGLVSMNPNLLSYFLRMLPNFGTVPIMILMGPEMEHRDALLTMVGINLAALSLMAIYVHVHVRDSMLLQYRVDDANLAQARINDELSVEVQERKSTESALAERNYELEALNERLADAQGQLLQSEKMASIGQLAAGIAHEINNPIAFVRSNLHSLKNYVADIVATLDQLKHQSSGGSGPPSPLGAQVNRKWSDFEFLKVDIPELLDESVEGAARVERIVRDLMDFSHLDQVDWQCVDIHKGIDTTLNVAAHELKFKVEVIKLFGELPLVECLPFQINQVFLNLLVNAAQAIEGHGTLTLRTGCNEDSIWVEFIDSGKGIEPLHLNRIFDPFFTTKPVGVGTGLGLSVSYSIIRNHGGRIEVDSTPGKGSKFTVYLPISARRSVS
jgi:signal transduction histidine kinase